MDPLQRDLSSKPHMRYTETDNLAVRGSPTVEESTHTPLRTTRAVAGEAFAFPENPNQIAPRVTLSTGGVAEECAGRAAPWESSTWHDAPPGNDEDSERDDLIPQDSDASLRRRTGNLAVSPGGEFPQSDRPDAPEDSLIRRREGVKTPAPQAPTLPTDPQAKPPSRFNSLRKRGHPQVTIYQAFRNRAIPTREFPRGGRGRGLILQDILFTPETNLRWKHQASR